MLRPSGPICLIITFLVNLSTFAGQVVISEIMYNPPSRMPEYIEIHNITATPLDLADWQLTDAVQYTFPTFSQADPSSAFLRPFETILVTGVDEQALRAAYNIPQGIRVFGPWSGKLDNGGERITLKDRNGFVLCSVRYNNRDPWPVAADGTGHSLVLKDSNKPIDDWRNWTISTRPGGSPGTVDLPDAKTPVPSPQISMSNGITYIDYGSVWRYHDKAVDLGTGWKEPFYSDSSWPQGPGLLGFETAALPGPGIQTPMADHDQITYYLRTSFTYNGPISGVTIHIDQILDDGAIYYLNGREIGRSGMPQGAVLFSTTAERTVGDAVEELSVITTDGSALLPGLNVLAVEVHQINATSSDVVFGARLRIVIPSGQELVVNELMPGKDGFIEFYNASQQTRNLKGCYLSDDAGNLRKYRITSDLEIAPSGLGYIGLAQTGLSLGSSATIFVVDQDGLTVLDAIKISIPLNGRSIGRQPDGSNTWYLFLDPTPGQTNAASELDGIIKLNEIHFTPTGLVDWVELYNQSPNTIRLDGLYLSGRLDLSNKLPLKGTIGPNAFTTIQTAFAPADGDLTILLVNSSGSVLDARRFKQPRSAQSLQAYPDGSTEWYSSQSATKGQPNDPLRYTEIVINEIMYHSPSDERTAEFIELFNRSDRQVDLSGWMFTDGIEFTFSQGTIIEPGGYLVVAADVDWMRSVYGNIPLVGNFTGRLSDQGERIRLVDHLGNLVDEVDYCTGGDWPSMADGGGSSLELINPWMDNSLPSAWADSDESYKSDFIRFSYSDVYRQLRADGQPTDYKELHLHLVGDSHVVLRNIQLRENGTGPNLLINSDRMSTDGRSSSGWLAQGNHYSSFIDSGQLHLIATGHGDNRANRVEIDATGMQQGRTYQISFDAKWISGLSRLIVQTWDHSIATSISIPVPTNLGTPGAENSCYNPALGLQLDNLSHSPAVPRPGQAAKVTVRVRSVSTQPKILLYHRLDNRDGTNPWASKPMYDDGTSGGDEVAGDGIYTATLTEYTSSGQVVQFFVLGLENGQISQIPRPGVEAPAMYVVDTPTPAGDLRRMRLVISALDLRDMSEGDAPTGIHGYAFPRLSNHYFNATLIVNEQQIFYNCGYRVTGSPWTRDGNRIRGKLRLPKDKPFRGKTKISFDDIAGGQVAIHNDRLVRYWLYLLGHPINENEFVDLEINANGTVLRDEIEPVDNEFLDRLYPDGSQGELYRIDDEWWFQDNWARTYRDADWLYKGTDNPGRYRTEWMKRSRENEDDYSSLVSFFKKVSGNYSQAEIERLLDSAAITKLSAVRGYAGDWDWFSMNRGKNGYFYRRPTDGLFMFLHWDSDLAFQSGYINSAFYNGMPGFRPYLEKPYNMRLFKHYLTRLVEEYTSNSARIQAWFAAEEQASSRYTVDTTLYRNWFTNRQTRAYNFLGNARTADFAITTNLGKPFSTSGDRIALQGTAPLRVFEVKVEDQPQAKCTWDSETIWRLEGIVLGMGQNNITVIGTDEDGRPLHSASITVTKTNNAPPVLRMHTPSWFVHAQEQVTLDLLGSLDPEGSVLDYQWSVTPSPAYMDATASDILNIRFGKAGIYTVTATASDAAGARSSISRQVMVYAPGDYDIFETSSLDPSWIPENIALRHNYCAGPYYSLEEIPGQLVMHVWDEASYPLARQTPAYPVIWRRLPEIGNWAFSCGMTIRGQIFGDYITGIVIQTRDFLGNTRYTFGIEDGSSLTVRKIDSTGAGSLLASRPIEMSDLQIRVTRITDKLRFEYLQEGTWIQIGSVDIVRGTPSMAGLFVATDTKQTVKIGFDFAVLINPDQMPAHY